MEALKKVTNMMHRRCDCSRLCVAGVAAEEKKKDGENDTEEKSVVKIPKKHRQDLTLTRSTHAILIVNLIRENM